MEITTRELRRMASAVDERHREAMRTFREETAELHLGAARLGLSDTDIAVFAESVELAAVAIYRDPDIGALVTPDIAAVAQLFAQHHSDHAGAFASLAGGKATGKANGPLVKLYTDTLKPAIKDQTGALKLAAVVEHQAASTYAFALTALQSIDAAAGTATILPVEAEHAVLLGAVLGQTPAELFPTGAFVSASVGAVGDPKVGIDPTIYPVG